MWRRDDGVLFFFFEDFPGAGRLVGMFLMNQGEELDFDLWFPHALRGIPSRFKMLALRWCWWCTTGGVLRIACKT